MLNLFQHPIRKAGTLQAIMPMQIGMMAFFNSSEHLCSFKGDPGKAKLTSRAQPPGSYS